MPSALLPRQASAPFITHSPTAFRSTSSLLCNLPTVSWGGSAPPFTLNAVYANGTTVPVGTSDEAVGLAGAGFEIHTGSIPSVLLKDDDEIVFEVVDAHGVSSKSLPLKVEDGSDGNEQCRSLETTSSSDGYVPAGTNGLQYRLITFQWPVWGDSDMLGWALGAILAVPFIAYSIIGFFLSFPAFVWFILAVLALGTIGDKVEQLTIAVNALRAARASSAETTNAAVFDAAEEGRSTEMTNVAASTSQEAVVSSTSTAIDTRGDFKAVPQDDDDDKAATHRKSSDESTIDTEEFQELEELLAEEERNGGKGKKVAA